MKIIQRFAVIFFLINLSCSHENGKDYIEHATIVTTGRLINSDSIKQAVTNPLPKLEHSIIKQSVRVSNKAFSSGSSYFLNYDTEQGLALSTISCGCFDCHGNLWLGTAGGGVSKFDGKTFTNYTTEHGLAGNSVFCILEDRYGNIWFGTDGQGVSKFNGKSFKNFTKKDGLTDNKVQSIAEDKKGNIWFGTLNGGICKYEGNTEVIVNAITKEEKNNVKAVNKKTKELFVDFKGYKNWRNSATLSILEDNKGNIWFGTFGDGIFKFDGENFFQFKFKGGLIENIINSIFQDKNGNIWFGTRANGIYKCDFSYLEKIRSKNSKLEYNDSAYFFSHCINYTTNDGLSNNYVQYINQDIKGDMWFATNGGGVIKYNGKSFSVIDKDHGLTCDVVTTILEDKNGQMWFGMQTGGLAMFNDCFEYFNTNHGLMDNIILSITEDKKGNMWFATYNGGLSCYHTNDKNESIPNSASKLSKKNASKSFTNYSVNNTSILCVNRDSADNILIGTLGGGFFKMDKNNNLSKVGLSDRFGIAGFVYMEDSKSNFWISSEKMVTRFNDKYYTNWSGRNGIMGSTIWDITEDSRGNIWIASQGDGGVYKYNGNEFICFTKKEGLISDNPNCITEDSDGNLWIGTEQGLMCFNFLYKAKNIKEKDSIQILNYNSSSGLPNNSVTQIVGLPNGKLALGTNNGIAIFNPKLTLKSNNLLAELEIFNPSTGYPIKDINVGYNSLYLDSKNTLWAGTGDGKIGLIRFDYSRIKKNTKEPNIKIDNIKINEYDVCYYSLDSETDSITLSQQEIRTYKKTLSINERDSVQKYYKGLSFDSIVNFYHLPYNLVIPYQHNNITIEFNCIEVSRHYMVNYQFMLEGYDDDWRPITKEQKAVYGNIDEGTYTFKVKAQSPDGIWSEPITYVFKVMPPWYRTWWMYVLYMAGSFMVLFLFFKWRTAALKERQKQLEQTVKERTAEVVEQKHLIEEKHKEITDSINYAERIQRALLASDKLLKENLTSNDSANRDYFILFKPKDVVSGDFYWATKIAASNQLENNHFVLVTADSTGHGVPGAIMSILNIACLDKAVTKGITSPDAILNEARKLIIENLKNDGSVEGGKDGMDGSLLSFDFEKNMLYCASANNPIWIIRASTGSATKEIIEIKADRMPIGKHEKDQTPFTLQIIQLVKGDIVYSLTDGFADQFGGSNGKKFKYKPLQELLLSINDKSLEIQKQTLSDTFDKWKGNLEQVDDVCLIGIKI